MSTQEETYTDSPTTVPAPRYPHAQNRDPKPNGRTRHPFLAIAFWTCFLAAVASITAHYLGRLPFQRYLAVVGAEVPTKDSEQIWARGLMHSIHNDLNSKFEAIEASGVTIEPSSLWSPADHLENPVCYCASYTTVLAQTLRVAGYPVRKVGLGKDGELAIHHVCEVHLDGKWVLMDCLFDLVFVKEDGAFASSKEVNANWSGYEVQVPENYDPNYDYSTFYFTNWNKIPVVGKTIEAMPSLKLWLHNKGVSVRFLLFDVWLWIGVFLLALSALFGFRLYVSKIQQERVRGR